MSSIKSNTIVVSEVTLNTALGNDAVTVARSILQKNSAARRHECIFASMEDDSTVPIIVAPMNELEHVKPQDRIIELFLKTIEPLVMKLPSNVDCSRVLFYVLLPPEQSYRKRWVYPKILHEALMSRFGHFKIRVDKFVVQGYESDSNFLGHFNRVSEQLAQEKNKSPWDMVIFGAVDSLIDLQSLEEIIESGDIRKEGDLSSTMPGEGAAFLMLQRKTDVSPGKWMVTIQTTPDYQESPALEMIVSDRRCTVDAEIQWHQRSKKLWPKLSPPEIRTQRWLGNLGAAHGPLMLVLAYGILGELTTEENATPVVGVFENASQDSFCRLTGCLL